MSVSLPPSSPFFVAPSCVYDGGLGLFAKANARFRKGDLLPFKYPGVHVRREAFEACNDYLHELTNKKLTARETEAAVNKLYEKHGISLVKTPDSAAIPNWDTIYDGFISYSMHLCESDCFIFWRSYNFDGKVIPDQRQNIVNAAHENVTYDMSAMYMNEPPPYTYFHNGYSGRGRLQQSRVNVTHKVDVHSNGTCVAFFQAVEDIEPCDELIYFYSVFNRRDYDLNMRAIPKPTVDLKDLTKKDQAEYLDFEKRIEQYKDKGYVYVARPWRSAPAAAAAAAEAASAAEAAEKWTLMPCKNGRLSNGNLTLEEIGNDGEFSSRGSIGWFKGFHTWTVQLETDAAGVYIGVSSSARAFKSDASHYISNAHHNAFFLQAVKDDDKKTFYLSMAGKKGQTIKVFFDLDKKTVRFAVDSMAPSKALALPKKKTTWYLYVGMVATNAKFTITSQE